MSFDLETLNGPQSISKVREHNKFGSALQFYNTFLLLRLHSICSCICVFKEFATFITVLSLLGTKQVD